MLQLRLGLLSLLTLSSLVACGGPRGETGPHFLFSADPVSADNPFPDARLLGSGALPYFDAPVTSGVLIREDFYEPFLPEKSKSKAMRTLMRKYANAAGQLDAVGTFGSMFLRISDDVDVGTVQGKVSRLVWSGEGYQVLENDVVIEHSHGSIGEGKSTDGVPAFLVAIPSVRVPEGGHGLLVVRQGVKTKDGRDFVMGAEFRELPEAKVWRAEAAKALGVGENEILFTVPIAAGKTRSVYERLARWTTEAQVPAFQIPAKAIINDAAGERPVGAWKSSETDWNQMEVWLKRKAFSGEAASVGQVVVGTIASRDLRNAQGIWSEGVLEDPASGTQVQLNFVLSLPTGAKPAAGWPVVIGGHGLGGRNTLRKNDNDSFCLMWAELLAQRGFGCLGIDAAEHGHRGDPISNFFTISDLPRIRERFRQTVFDLMQLSRTAQVLDVDGDGTADLAQEIGYFGHSLGGIVGSAYVSSDPRVRFSVLAAPGGGLSNILTSPDIKTKIGLLIAAEVALTFESVEYDAAFPLFRLMGQLFLEAGDPVNLAGISPDRAALVLEEIQDLTVPNKTTADLAMALGISLSPTPISGQAPLQVLYRADPADYVSATRLQNYNAHDLIFENSATPLRNLIQNFLESRGTRLSLD